MLRNSSPESSHSNLYPVGHEQLFAELSASEAALIEGGGIFLLDNISCSDEVQNPVVVVKSDDEETIAKPGDDFLLAGVPFKSKAVVTVYDKAGDGFSKFRKLDSFSIPGGADASSTLFFGGCFLTYKVFESVQ